MIVGKAIYYLLTNATDVTDVVSTRVYPEIAQQDADLPYIVYAIANNEPTDTKPEPSKLDTAQVEVNIYSQSYTEAIDLAVAVRAALDRVKGTYSGVNVQSIQYLNEIIDFDEPQRAYNISADYDVRISRTDFEIAQGSPISGTNLGELNDVDVTGVTNGQLIAYNSTTGNWEAADDAGGAETLGDLDDVNVDNPLGGQSIMWDGGLEEWVKDSRTTALFDEFKQGLVTTVKNGAGKESELKLEQTKATVQTGITKVVLTETSPGNIEFVVATDANGDTAFTALHLDGSSTANVADLLVKFGTYFKLEDGIYTQWIRPSSGTTQDTAIVLPSKSGVLGLAEDIPTSVTNLNDVTSAGSGAIITDAERTNLTTNTAKVGLIAGGTTGQALVKSTGTDYDVQWADIAIDVQYHQRYDTEAAALRSGATETVELYYTAQADGDGLSESASSDTPTSGYDIRRKLWYAEKAQADPDTSADWTQFTAIADNTTFANAKAALLAYLKERTGGTVPISLKMTWEEVSQVSYLLDDYSGAAAAYSLRLLSSTYSGDAINVWNGTSYADIGFDGSGELDTTALAAHCGSNDGFIRYWYDQSGNSNTAAQATTANMPKIYDGTTGVVTENGKPTVQFDGASDYMEFGESWGAEMTMIATWKASATGEQQIYNMESGGIRFAMSTNRSGNSIVTRDNSGAGTSSLSGNPTITTLGITSHITNSTSTSHSLHHNNVSLTGTAASRAQNGTNTFASNSGGTSFFLNGVMSEAVLYLSDKTTDRTGIEDNINTFYSIY